MKIQRGFKFRLNVDTEQQDAFWKQAGCNRYVWNAFLRYQESRRKRGHFVERYESMANKLTMMKKEVTFLKTDCQSATLQQTLKDLYRAYQDGFDKKQPNKRLPKPKKKHSSTNSFRYPAAFKVEGNRVFLPKLGWFTFRKSRDIIGKVKNVTVSHKGGHWYVSFQTEYERTERPHQSSSIVGVDLGVKRLATLSSGHYVQGLDNLRQSQAKLKRLQRQLARKIKFSANWRKIKTKISRLHTRIANCRHDFLHKFSSYLSKSHAMIVFEDLNIKGMSKSAKGTLDEPGKMVKQKSGLNKAILDQGWSMLVDFCKYKQRWKKGEVIRVPAPGTSQRCSSCGHKDKANRQSQSQFHCNQCENKQNADDNASLNIEAAGHAVLSCGGPALAGPMKQGSTFSGNATAITESVQLAFFAS
jgi:IS605 OrfB family transposase